MAEPFWETNLIYTVVAGSQAYGLDRPDSDLDIRGVCIPPLRYLLGLSDFEQWEHQDESGDTIIYALTKLVRLALACNPNIIELLYTEPRHVLYIDEYGQRLVEHRHLFLSKQARHTFAGYAISQLQRIERHHRWLVNPPDHKPTQGEFGGWPVEGRFKFPDHEAYRAYQAALKHWNQYQAWRKNRSPARAELERQCGKHSGKNKGASLHSGHGCCARRNPSRVTLRAPQGRPFESLPSTLLGAGRAGFGIAGFRGGGGQVEVEWVRVVFAHAVGHVHGGATALAELAASEIEEFTVTGDKTLPF